MPACYRFNGSYLLCDILHFLFNFNFFHFYLQSNAILMSMLHFFVDKYGMKKRKN